MYVLPTNHRSFIEYTLFSHQLLTKEEYEQEIKQYIENLGIQNLK
jgi:lycopene beta-cyclase